MPPPSLIEKEYEKEKEIEQPDETPNETEIALMAEPTVTCALDPRADGERVARVTLDRREKLNIVNTALLERLAEAFDWLAGDESLRAVVLAGAGDRAFIGGADINEMAGLEPESARAFIGRLHRVCAAIRAVPVPVIARIQGYCLGGGLEIAAACDLRVAETGARFGMPEVKVGIPSVIEAALLPRLVGWGRARELVYLGETIECDEALRIGLVERVAARGQLDAGVEKIVAALLGAGPRATRLQKALIRKWETLPPDEAAEASIPVFGSAFETDEPRRLMQRFLDRKR